MWNKSENNRQAYCRKHQKYGKDIHIASWNNAADNLTEIAKALNLAHGTSGKVIIDMLIVTIQNLNLHLSRVVGFICSDIFQTQNRDIPAFYNNYGLKSFADLSDIVKPDADKWVDYVKNC